MAKQTRAFKATNAMIDKDEMKLIETTKDGQLVYDLSKILDQWHKVDGIGFNITLNEEIEPDDTVY